MQYDLYDLLSLQFQPFHYSTKLYTTYLEQHSPITESNILKGHLFLRFPLTASRSPSSPSNPTLSHSYCILWILSPLHPKLLDFCPTEPRLWSLNSNMACVSRLPFSLHTAGLLEIARHHSPISSYATQTLINFDYTSTRPQLPICPIEDKRWTLVGEWSKPVSKREWYHLNGS